MAKNSKRNKIKNRANSNLLKKIGSVPGELIYTGNKRSANADCTLYAYDENELQIYKSEDFDIIKKTIASQKVNWLNIDGLNDLDNFKKIADYFDFSQLMSEDILNTEHLPKMEEYEEYLFFTLKMLRLGHEKNHLEQEHLCIILCKNAIITFQENIEGDDFDAIRDRIKKGVGRVRKHQTDYLFYLLVDAVVDNYFYLMEDIRLKVEDLEEEILENTQKNIMNEVLTLKKELSSIRKLVTPLKEELEKLLKLEEEEAHVISQNTLNHFRDVYDNIKYLIVSFDNYREMLTGLIDLYMSNLSHSMNTIMKTLTVITTIFIPLTFLAGLYGMNFKYMPELAWKLSYPVLLGIMLGIGISLYIFFKRKRWI